MSSFFHRFFLISVMLLMAQTVLASLPIVDSQGDKLPSLAPLVSKVAPSVVNISTYTTQTYRQNPLLNDPFFRHFFNVPQGQKMPQTRRTQSAGSGVIIDAKNGTVVTNHHVINGADEIHVGLQDGRSFQAKLIGSDPDVDIAVLELIDFDGLQALPVADSEAVRVGDFVIAIGNPFGLGQSVTTGVVSALGRSGLGIEGYENFIQTDASINPGNSGGALVNLNGELVGINTAIIAPAGGNVGIGFAIPTNMAKASIDQIVEFGEVKRGRLGVVIQDLTRDLAKAFDVDEQQKGVLVAEVQPGSGADKAGIKAGDVIISVEGAVIESAAELRNTIGQYRVDDRIEVTILREGRSKLVKAKLISPESSESGSASIHPQLEGASLQESLNEGGIEITAVAEGSKAAAAGLQRGDIILSVNRHTVNSLDELRKLASRSKSQLVLRIRRGNAAFYLVLR